MSETLREQAGEAPRQLRPVTGRFGWFLLVLGVVVAAVAGAVLARAWFSHDMVNGCIGALQVIGGVLLAIYGGMRTRRPSQTGSPAGHDTATSTRPAALPRLGELLVHKYHLISGKDLQRALARQREFAGHDRAQ